jgi:hypothetical protein
LPQQVLLDFRTTPPASVGEGAHVAGLTGARFSRDHWVLSSGGEAVISFRWPAGPPLGRVTLVGAARGVASAPVEVKIEANGTLVWTREGLPGRRTREMERFTIPRSVLRPGPNALTVRNCGPADTTYRLYKVCFEPLT